MHWKRETSPLIYKISSEIGMELRVRRDHIENGNK